MYGTLIIIIMDIPNIRLLVHAIDEHLQLHLNHNNNYVIMGLLQLQWNLITLKDEKMD